MSLMSACLPDSRFSCVCTCGDMLRAALRMDCQPLGKKRSYRGTSHFPYRSPPLTWWDLGLCACHSRSDLLLPLEPNEILLFQTAGSLQQLEAILQLHTQLATELLQVPLHVCLLGLQPIDFLHLQFASPRLQSIFGIGTSSWSRACDSQMQMPLA